LFDLVKQSVVLNEDPVTMQMTNVPSYEEARSQFTRDYLVNNLQKTGGNITEAARVPNAIAPTFTSYWRAFGLEPRTSNRLIRIREERIQASTSAREGRTR